MHSYIAISSLRRIPPIVRDLICVGILFSINAVLIHALFPLEYSRQMGSIEGSYMAIAKWARDHVREIGWFPLWFSGMPYYGVYQPGLHTTVAALSSLSGWTIQHSYHFLTASAYCLGPVTLFFLCARTTGSRLYAFLAALMYSLVSLACLFSQGIRADTDGATAARRLVVLVRYGEGPHTTAVMLIPIVLLLLHWAVTEKRPWALFLAPFALGTVVVTNWPGTVGLLMAIAAYTLSGVRSWRVCARMLAVAAVAYLLICRWIPPSLMMDVLRSAQQATAVTLEHRHIAAFSLLVLGLLVLEYCFVRAKAPRWLRFFLHFSVLTGTIGFGQDLFGWSFLPQPNRFQVEFDLASAASLAWVLWSIARRLTPLARVGVIVAFSLVGIWEARCFLQVAGAEIGPTDITRTIEYQMSMQFGSAPGKPRVFAPGNVSLWMNTFNDTPQVAGCCDQSVPDFEDRIAAYTIYTGQNAGKDDAKVSIVWLKTYGADQIGIVGPESTEYFHPFWNPRKFDGVLPVLWRSGDNAIYDVCRRSRSLAHVVPPARLVSHRPENGLVIAPLVQYVEAIESPSAPRASMRWSGPNHAVIEADVPPGQVISLQVNYNRGWRATSQGVACPTYPDALGLLVIRPRGTGPCVIQLSWSDTGLSVRWIAEATGLIAALAWAKAASNKSRRKGFWGATSARETGTA